MAKVLDALHSRASGLSEEEAKALLAAHGPNRLEVKKKTSPVVLFLRQFLSPLIYVLVAAAAISPWSSLTMSTQPWSSRVLVLNAIIGFVQEQQAEKAMDALLKMTAPKAQVRRDATVTTVPAESLVPGDIILLESGNRVPADARVIEETNLKVNEASLTGESSSVDKEIAALPSDTPMADRNNMVYMSTIVSYGRAAAVVTGTGM